jgi:hypothetical protein
MPMSGSENGPVQLSDDGKTVSMPIETFRAREGDLLRLEAMVTLLQKQLDEERALSEKLAYQLKGIESALTDERSALKNEISKTKRTYGLMGFVLGGIAVGVAK